ncbi:unnamed protein product [Darwinula stevensoni]|uniref:Peptidase S1 domain-containing protein n=1 Tax=Darwinula stevensoni TaxID=69355 RepID=A0A7R9A2M4_9CRUS|nr:unnamed protein product [Darwinula stevensoni]CAG0885973.1 unnamed protein product [Darwinula stevensoni]
MVGTEHKLGSPLVLFELLAIRPCLVMLISLTLCHLILFSWGTLVTSHAPCPKPQDISPCTCSYSEESQEVNVDCSGAITSQSILDAFSNAYWPSIQLTKFRLSENDKVLTLPDGVFGNITFQRIHAYQTKMRTINATTFKSSRSRLQSLNIWNSRLEDFPFAILPELTQLKILDLHGNALETVPALESESLQELYLYDNQIVTFQGKLTIPNLKSLNIGGNPISKLPSDFFEDLENLEVFWCPSCKLGPILTSRTFQFHSPVLREVGLFFNTISRLEPRAITGLTMNTSVELWSNQIDSLEEKSFRPMLKELSKGNGYISLFGNPTRCDCSVAWLISSPDLLKSVKDAYCLDGTAFTDFDVTLFKRCRLCEHECVDPKQASLCSPGTTTPSRPHDCRPEESCCKPKIPKENPPKCGSKRNVHSSGAANTSMDQTPFNFDEWPWQVAIYSVNEQSIICGGALIREKWVLTSAGCLNKFQDPRILFVRLEKLHSNESRDDQSMEPMKVSKIILHDDFNAENYDSNVALLKLRKRAELSQRVQLVCLPSEPWVNLKEGTRGWVVNWRLNGTTEEMVVSKCHQDTAHPITRATSDKVFCSTNNSKNSDSGLLFFHFDK